MGNLCLDDAIKPRMARLARQIPAHNKTHTMNKTISNNRLAAALVVGASSIAVNAQAALVDDAVTALAALATPIASGAAALFAITLVFMGLRYARRLASK